MFHQEVGGGAKLQGDILKKFEGEGVKICANAEEGPKIGNFIQENTRICLCDICCSSTLPTRRCMHFPVNFAHSLILCTEKNV